MTISKTQLLGGPFCDSLGNVLANGYLKLKLNQDETIPGTCLVGAGITTTIKLNSSGDVDTSTPQSVWATDVMSPVNAFYIVTGYTALGQRAWGPNNQQVTSGSAGGGTFDVGTWTPNAVFSWIPPITEGVLTVTTSVTTSSLTPLVAQLYNAGNTLSGTVVLAKDYIIQSVTVDSPARVRLYQTAAERDADLGRSFYIPPTTTGQTGVVTDLVLDTAQTWRMAPPANGTNGDSPQVSVGYVNITNIGNATTPITVTFVFTQLQA